MRSNKHLCNTLKITSLFLHSHHSQLCPDAFCVLLDGCANACANECVHRRVHRWGLWARRYLWDQPFRWAPWCPCAARGVQRVLMAGQWWSDVCPSILCCLRQMLVCGYIQVQGCIHGSRGPMNERLCALVPTRSNTFCDNPDSLHMHRWATALFPSCPITGVDRFCTKICTCYVWERDISPNSWYGTHSRARARQICPRTLSYLDASICISHVMSGSRRLAALEKILSITHVTHMTRIIQRTWYQRVSSAAVFEKHCPGGRRGCGLWRPGESAHGGYAQNCCRGTYIKKKCVCIYVVV